MDNVLKSSLSDQTEAGKVAAHIATCKGDPAVLGFCILGAFAVRAGPGPKESQRAGVHDVPAIHIRAVAVRADAQGTGLARAQLIDAIRRCLWLSDQTGAAAIVLDVFADDTSTADEFCRGSRLPVAWRPDNPNRVFVPMPDVRATRGPAS